MVHAGSLCPDKSIVAPVSKNPVDSALRAKHLGADILELRIDLMSVDEHRSLKELIHELKHTGLPVIITNRMREEGGAWSGTEAERVQTLISLLPLADAVDIELRAGMRDAVVNQARTAGKAVIVSTHDFQRTPDYDAMMDIIRRSFDAGADIAKLAVMPGSYEDVLRLLDVTLHAEGAVCTIAMGEIGRHSRIIAPIYGSVMTYGYVDAAVAPGQMRVDELRSILKKLGLKHP